MARIGWTAIGSRFFEAGVDRGVLYLDAVAGIPWIGLISVEENPTGGEATPFYIDGIKYLNLSAAEEFEATINAYTYPVEFADCDGTARVRAGLFFGQQRRKSFGFSYRTMVGNDIEGIELGYKIHLVYNALAAPASRSAKSFNDSTEASDFTWDLTTRAPRVSGYAPTAHVIVDSRYTDPTIMSNIEDILYGDDENVAHLPTPDELIEIIDTPIEWTVTDEGGGLFFIGGPEGNVDEIADGLYTLTHPSITNVDADSSNISY